MDIKNEKTLIKLTKEFWTQRYQSNIGKLIGICYRYTGNYALSEDLAHDAFLKAIEKAQSFRGDGHFDAWLRRIVVNHILQHLRDQKKNPNLQQLTPEQAAAIPSQENTFSTQPMEFSTNELLETINELPEHHRLVFNLYVMEKFSHAQIGDELGISEGTSKSHLARARKKLQQLLTQKIADKQEKGNKERAAILLVALTDDKDMDEMFIKSFARFSIPPKNPLSLPFQHFPRQNIFKRIVPKKSLQVIVTSSAGIMITLTILFFTNKTHHQPENKLNDTVSVPVLTDKDADETGKKNENILASSATNSKDTVNTGRNKKLRSMKPLDSLALLLALSSGTVNASSFKDSIKNQIQQPGLEVIQPAVDTTAISDQSKTAIVPENNRAERGTFRADELYWNKDSKEVYFKGKVRVDFTDQHFNGTGSFNILGTVYLLIVGGETVEAGKTIKLANQDYHLAVLDSSEATAKYGSAGKNGAIVIYKSE